MHLDAVEHNEEIVFMHNVKAGAASKSYGLQVARLAGLPANVLSEARARLQELESKTHTPSRPAQHSQQLALFHSTNDAELTDYLKPLKVDNISPREALDHLYEMVKLLD